MCESLGRSDILFRLKNTGEMAHTDANFFHGRLFRGDLTPPTVTWRSEKKPRNGYDTPDWLTATEFMDTCPSMEEKAFLLANLLKLSKKTVVYV